MRWVAKSSTNKEPSISPKEEPAVASKADKNDKVHKRSVKEEVGAGTPSKGKPTWKGWQESDSPWESKKGSSYGSKGAAPRKGADYWTDKGSSSEQHKGRYGKGSQDDWEADGWKKGPAKGWKGGKSGEPKGKSGGKGKGSSGKDVAPARTVQEVEAEISKPQNQWAARGPDNASKRPMDATGDHCVVHKHSGMGCAVISMDSKSIRETVLNYAERQSPSGRNKPGAAEMDIDGLKVEIKRHVDRNTQQDVVTDIFAAWGHQAERQRVLEPEMIAEAFDKLYDKAMAEGPEASPPASPPHAGAPPTAPCPQHPQGFCRPPAAGVMMPPAPPAGPGNQVPVATAVAPMGQLQQRPVGNFVQQPMVHPMMAAAAQGMPPQMAQMPRPPAGPYGPAMGMSPDFNPQLAYWMQQQQYAAAQQQAVAPYAMGAQASVNMGPCDPMQFQQGGSALGGGAGQVPAAELSRPLPKPMRIVNPTNGTALETLGMNFKPREERRPLEIKDPKSGAAINVGSDES